MSYNANTIITYNTIVRMSDTANFKTTFLFIWNSDNVIFHTNSCYYSVVLKIKKVGVIILFMQQKIGSKIKFKDVTYYFRKVAKPS